LPGRFLRVLGRAGCLAPWLAELAGAHAVPAGPAPYHAENLLAHTAEVMDRLAALLPGNETAAWMGLCHDLGKAATPAEEYPRHHGHAERGGPMAQALGERLALPGALIRAGVLAAERHMVAGAYGRLRPGTRVDLLDRLQKEGVLREMFALVVADNGSDHLARAEAELATMLAVRLPPGLRGLGPESGAALRTLRAQRLADRAGRD